MQLFISDQFFFTDDTIIITEERIIHQCSRVLRMKLWNQIQIQNYPNRYTLSLTEFSKNTIRGNVIQHQTLSHSKKNTTLAIALPNRRDKAELITQKLTEIGINNIIFFPSSRSVLKTTPIKKQERIKQIALEASEQSFRDSLPEITFLERWDEKYILWQSITIFHIVGSPYQQSHHNTTNNIMWIIWPEWWRSDEELLYWKTIGSLHTIGNTVLRMETACIISWRLLSN